MKIVQIIIIVLFSLQVQVFAQVADLSERVFSGKSEKESPIEAKKDIQDQAVQKISEDLIVDLIGNSRFEKNKNAIQNKIIKNSSNYIPYVKSTEIEKNGEEFKMSVTLKVSIKELRQMLQMNSFLSENDASPVVLPIVTWIDRIQGKTFRWWIPGDKAQAGFLVKQNHLFEGALRSSFQKNNLFILKPANSSLGQIVPAPLQTDDVMAVEKTQLISQYFNASILIDGQILIMKGERGNNYKIEIKLAAFQVNSGRSVADVSRRFETENGSVEIVVDRKLRQVLDAASNDLAAQVFDSWQRGTLNANVLKLSLRGRTSLPMIEGFKEKVRAQISSIKNIHERLISADTVLFEVETSAPVNELVGKIEMLSFENKKVTKVSIQGDDIVMKWIN